MDSRDMDLILIELCKMEPDLGDADWDVMYSRCLDVYQKIDDFRNYTLTEFVDALTFEKRWFWRKKS